MSCAAQGRSDAASRRIRLVQLGIGHELLSPRVLLLKVLQPLCLVDPQAPELLLPSVVGLLGLDAARANPGGIAGMRLPGQGPVVWSSYCPRLPLPPARQSGNE